MAETKVLGKVTQCPMGTGLMIVSVDNTCKACPHFKEVMAKNTKEAIPEKVHCIVPTKMYRPTLELTEIAFKE